MSADLISSDLTFLVGSDHWLVAYRKAEEQKYRKVLQRIKEKDGGTDTRHGNMLDGPLLV